MEGNLSVSRGRSSFESCWGVPNQINCVLFGFSESRLEDIQRCKSREREYQRGQQERAVQKVYHGRTPTHHQHKGDQMKSVWRKWLECRFYIAGKRRGPKTEPSCTAYLTKTQAF